LTQARLKQLLDYDPTTGIFTRRVSRGGMKKGSVAGFTSVKGYTVIGVDGKLYSAHRLAWLYVYGVMPREIDHRNRVKTDNSILNLREASRAMNNQNKVVGQKNSRSGLL